MTVPAWAAFALLAAAALALTFWLYLRREAPGRGRVLLALLRSSALVLVLLLLFDPELPARGAAGAARAPLVLLDASASMGLPLEPGSTRSRWSEALERARERADGRPVLLFGTTTRPVDADSLLDLAPSDTRSLLLPALRAAAESGARRVVVFTDAGIEDASSLPAWLPRLGLDVAWERIGEALPGGGIREVTAPAWAASGRAVEVEAVVGASGGNGAREVVIRQGTVELGRASVEMPAPGRIARVTIPVRPVAPAGGGSVRLDVTLEPGDALAADDRRAVMLHVAADPAGIVLISGRPDWEPRFLLPVLERSLGLPARGFLQTAPGVWTRLGDGAGAGRRVSEGDVARAASAADLLVLHAPRASGAPWLVSALGSARAWLVIAPEQAGGITLPVTLPASIEDDWFAVDDVPPSPVAPVLAGVPTGDAPPLTALAPLPPPAGTWAPLGATRGRRGPAYPLLLAGEQAGRRWAVATGQGYWRWAFRPGEPRQLYERLWSAVGGWLLAGQTDPAIAAVRPVPRIVPRGQRAAWVAAGVAPDSIRLRARSATGQVDTLLLRGVSDTLIGPRLAPGEWRWEATAYTAGGTLAGAGELFVEEYSAELARPAVPLEALRVPETVGRQGVARAGTTPLHTNPIPYLLIVVLLATEWVLRRRWGLR